MKTPQKIVSPGEVRFGGAMRALTVTADNFALHRALVRRERIERRKCQARARRKARVEALRKGLWSVMGTAARPVVRVLQRETVTAAGALEEGI